MAVNGVVNDSDRQIDNNRSVLWDKPTTIYSDLLALVFSFSAAANSLASARFAYSCPP